MRIISRFEYRGKKVEIKEKERRYGNHTGVVYWAYVNGKKWFPGTNWESLGKQVIASLEWRKEW